MRNSTLLKLSFILGLLISVTVSNAQVTIVASDFSSNLDLGDQVTSYLDTTIAQLDVGSAGQFNLDYSMLNAETTFVTESKEVAGSPYASDFPNAEYASNYSGVFAGVQSNSWVYNSIDANFLTYGTGTVANTTAGDVTTVISFDPAWIEYTLPINLNDQNTWSGMQTIKTTTTVSGLGEVTTTLEQDVTVTQDVNGYGTILLPGNKQIDALRIVEVTTFTTNGISNSSTVIKFLSKTGEIIAITPSSDANVEGTVAVDQVNWTSGDAGGVVIEAPAAPDQLTAAATTSSVDISWSDNSDNETGFYIHRSDDDAGFVLIDSVAADVTSYSDTGLVVGVKYTYRVSAYNESSESAFSNSVDAMLFVEAVDAPNNLMTTSTENSAELTWNDNSSNEIGFYIERSDDGGDFMVIDSVSADVTTYTDTALLAGVDYSYRVQAFSEYVMSDFSNTTDVYITPTAVLEMKEEGNSLAQNYPNPFAGRTTISFSLARQGDVQLLVLNSDGRQVKMLLNRNMIAGKHQVDFKTDGLESGSYFYRLQSRDFVETKSMMIIK